MASFQFKMIMEFYTVQINKNIFEILTMQRSRKTTKIVKVAAQSTAINSPKHSREQDTMDNQNTGNATRMKSPTMSPQSTGRNNEAGLPQLNFSNRYKTYQSNYDNASELKPEPAKTSKKGSEAASHVIRQQSAPKRRSGYHLNTGNSMRMSFKQDMIERSSKVQRSRTLRSRVYDECEDLNDLAINLSSDGVKKNESEEAAERLKKYQDNTAMKLNEKLKYADNYMDKVTKTINLSELYEIADYYYTSETQKICPVLLKIKHSEILKQENPGINISCERHYKFLLQIWRKADSIMLYERKLREAPMGWGMQNSDESFDMFFYQEADGEDNCEENQSRVFCFAFREAKESSQQEDDIKLHAFSLPLSIKQAQAIDVGNAHIQFCMGAETEENEDALYSSRSLSQRGGGKVEPEASLEDQNLDTLDDISILERYNLKRSQAAPNIKRNICCINGKLVLATHTTLIELDLRKLMEDKTGNWKTFLFGEMQFDVKPFRETHCKWITIENDYRFINFTDAGADGTAMILEHNTTKQIRFVLLLYDREVKQEYASRQKPKLQFEQLGLAQRSPENKADIVKTCTAQSEIKLGAGNNAKSNKMFSVTMVLRTNGLVEVYSDYELTEQGKCPNQNLFCVDVVADTEHFYLKYLKLEVDSNRPSKLLFEIRQVSHQWRSSIQYSHSKVVEEGRDWDSCQLKTLSRFMRLYPEWLIYSNHFLVAHRGYISVQDLNTEDYDLTVKYQPKRRKRKNSSIFCCPGGVGGSSSEEDSDSQQYQQSQLMMTSTAASMKSKWIQHIKVCDEQDMDLNHIREMYLEKRDRRGIVNAPDETLRYHAQPDHPLHKRFVVCVIVGLDKILSFNLKKSGKLEKCRIGHVRKTPGCIINIKTDYSCRTGTLLTVEGSQLYTQSKYEGKYAYQHWYFEEEASTIQTDNLKSNLDGHKVYTDMIRRASVESTGNYKIMHLNYKQLNCIFKSYLQTEKQAAASPILIQQNVDESYSSDKGKTASFLRDTNSNLDLFIQKQDSQSLPNDSPLQGPLLDISDNLYMDGQLKVVKTCKSLWQEEIEAKLRANKRYFGPDEHFDKKLRQPSKKEETITAILSYKKGQHLKLIPFFKPITEKNPELGPSLLASKRAYSYDDGMIPALEADPKNGDYYLCESSAIDLLDQEQCIEILKEEDIVLFTFVGHQQKKQDIEENSFIIVTHHYIHVFNEKIIEIARIEGLQIVSAQLIDTSYLYVMEEFCDQIFERHAEEDNEHQLSDPVENENFVQESGLTAINFHALFLGHFKEIWVCHAATGHNCGVKRSWTTDDFSIMRSLEEVAIMPIPHWNSMSFVGMGSKNQYLIWKDSLDGFFTALRNNGELITWSSVTGKLLWEEQQEGEFAKENLRGYKVYRSDAEDTTYLGNYYNYNDANKIGGSYSLSLLASTYPVDKKQIQEDIQKCAKENGGQPSEQHELITKELLRHTGTDLNDYDQEFFNLKKNHNNIMPPMFSVQDKKGLNGITIAANPRKFKEKLIRNKLYHFKVVQLKQFEDVMREKQMKVAKSTRLKKFSPNDGKIGVQSECKLLYHFFHKLLHPFKTDATKQKYFEKSDWFLNYENIKQRLYLSVKAEKMLEVLQNRLAIIWQQQNGQAKTNGELVSWERYHTLPNFPFYAQEVSSLPYFISDDFNIMCEFSSKEKKMRIVKTKPKSSKDEDRVVGVLPIESLHLPTESNFEQDMIKQAFACVAIRGSHEVLTYNSKSGLMTKWPLEEQKGEDRKLKLLVEEGETFLSNSFDFQAEWNGTHLFEDPNNLKSDFSIEGRIFNLSAQFQYFMRQRCARRQLKRNGQAVDLSEKYKYAAEALKHLQDINYGFQWTDANSSFVIDRAFAWIDWKRAELIETKQEEHFECLQQDEKLRLLHSVFPQGNSLLRMLALTTRSQDKDKKQDSSNDAEAMFKSAQEGFDVKVGNSWKRICPEVPLITDCFGLQPMDYAFGMCKEVQDDKDYSVRFLTLAPEEKNEIEKSENLKLVQVIFSYTKDYRSFQNTLNMVQPVIKAVELQLPQVFDYLNSRIVRTQHIPNALNTAIMDDKLHSTPTLGEYGLHVTDDLTQTETAQGELFQEKEPTESEKKKLYDYWWFDVPLIFEKTKDGYDFMTALRKTNNVDIYAHKGIQLIVENQWLKWHNFNICVIMIPMCVQLVVFSINSCIFQPQRENVSEWLIISFETISAVVAVYFVCIEIIAVQGVSLAESKSSWQELCLNFLSPILVLLTQIISFFFAEKQNAKVWFWELLAWTSFFLWYRFLLMLRSVPQMSPAVSMVIRSLREIKPYLIVVLIGVFAFSDAFQSLDQIAYMKAAQTVASDDESFKEPPFDKDMKVTDFSSFKDKYAGEYITMLKSSFIGSVIGYEGEGIGLWTDLQWLLYLVAIVFNAIVLMNVLLALVGEIFSEVHGKSSEYTYQQLVNQICLLQRINNNPTKRNSLNMMFMASQRKEVGEADAEATHTTSDDSSQAKFEKLNEQLAELLNGQKELDAKVDRMQQAKKKKRASATKVTKKQETQNFSPLTFTKKTSSIEATQNLANMVKLQCCEV